MLLTVHSFLEVPRMQHLKMQAAMHVLYMRKERVHMGMGERDREREIYARRPCIVLQRGVVGRVPWCKDYGHGCTLLGLRTGLALP